MVVINNGQITGLLETGSQGNYQLGSPFVNPVYTNSQGAIHTFHTNSGQNFCPVSIEYYPSSDRRSTNQYQALSAFSVASIFQDNTAVSPPGLGYQSQVNVFVMVANTSAQPSINPSTNGGVNDTGFTNLTANMTSARPSQFNNANSIAADHAALAYWEAQTPNVFGVKPPITPPTLENFYSTTDQGDFCFLDSRVMGRLVVAENDMQINGIDDVGIRGGISIIVDQKQRTGANNGASPPKYFGGPPASISQAFYVNGIAGAFVTAAYSCGDNCLRGFDSRNAVDAFTAVITPPRTTASLLAALGTPAPAAAPTPPSGGTYTVIHIDSVSPITPSSTFPFYVGGSQGSGIGGFIVGDIGGSAVSLSYPCTFSINGNNYQAVAYQLDGPGTESGYLIVKGAMPASDCAVGQVLSRPMAALWMGDQQRINLEHTGSNYIAFSPAVNNGYGGTNVNGSLRITNGMFEVVSSNNVTLSIDPWGDVTTSGNMTITGSTLTLGTASDLNQHTLYLSPRDGGHGLQWAPFAGQLQFISSGKTVATLDTAGDLSLSGKINATSLTVNNTQVVGARQTGWNTPLGSLSRSLLSSNANTTQIIETINALITDLFTHGLLGN